MWDDLSVTLLLGLLNDGIGERLSNEAGTRAIQEAVIFQLLVTNLDIVIHLG